MDAARVGRVSDRHRGFDARLAAYLAAAGAVGAAEAQGAIVGNNAVQPFGVDGDVNIDFNTDGQTDFQIDHDRVTVGSETKDYLQLDKNDINGAGNPLAFDPLNGNQAATFPVGATVANDQNIATYVINGPQGSYPAALTLGTAIGPTSTFDYQETSNFQGGGKWIRANRLIDEDATAIDQVLGGQPASGVQVPFSGPNFLALGGDVRYLGVKMDLNNSDLTNSGLINYGWIGIRITNEADATGEVVGYAYETTPGVPIAAGVPEPGSLVLIGAMGCILLTRRFGKRFSGSRSAT